MLFLNFKMFGKSRSQTTNLSKYFQIILKILHVIPLLVVGCAKSLFYVAVLKERNYNYCDTFLMRVHIFSHSIKITIVPGINSGTTLYMVFHRIKVFMKKKFFFADVLLLE